jgi:hypothetical protein
LAEVERVGIDGFWGMGAGTIDAEVGVGEDFETGARDGTMAETTETRGEGRFHGAPPEVTGDYSACGEGGRKALRHKGTEALRGGRDGCCRLEYGLGETKRRMSEK